MNPASRIRFVLPSGLLLAIAVLALTVAPRAQADLVFWGNYSAEPGSVSFANIDGSGGGALNLTGVTLDGPEGLTFDSATGRLFVASYKNNKVLFANVDGSGAGVLNTGAPVEDPYGVAIDPGTRKIYWVNGSGGFEDNGSIGWADIDGGGGGTLNTAGATVDDPYRIALDPVGGRVYWSNYGTSPLTLSYANVNNSGGADLDTSGATPPTDVYGLAVDVTSERLYWLDSANERLSFASLSGGGGGDIDLGGTFLDDGYGLAIDPTVGRLYWGNAGNDQEREGAIRFLNLAGAGSGGITPLFAPVNAPQDPVILKSPVPVAPPAIMGIAPPRRSGHVSCSQGVWGADFPGSFVYRAPRTFSYQWTLNGAPIPGATGRTYFASAPGAYGCTVTASNHAGSATQVSAPVTIGPPIPKILRPRAPRKATLGLELKKRKAVRVRIGKLATFPVTVRNQGQLPAANAHLCVKVPKQLRKYLRPRKCKRLNLPPGAQRVAKLKVKVKPKARGRKKRGYKLRIVPRGIPGKAIPARLKVIGK